MSEGFESAGFPPTGWTTQNYNAANNTWTKTTDYVHTGSCAARVTAITSTNANAWLFTKPLSLTAGKYYELKYFVTLASSIGTVLKVTLGASADQAGQQRLLRGVFPAAASGGTYYMTIDSFACTQTGTYYIGFNNCSPAGYYMDSRLDDVSLTELNFPVCSAVSAGTVNAVSTICANTPFTITNTGATVNNEGTVYAWQRSPDAVNWTNITDSYQYQSSLQVNQSTDTWYRLTDTCILSGTTAVSNSILVNKTPFINCYCIPPFVSCSGNLSLTNVNIYNSTINNTSTCNTGGYTNYSSAGNANVYKNQNIYIQHTVTNQYPASYTVGVWVDLNHDGYFDSTEFSSNGPFSLGTAISQFTVPPTALSGETRMRLRMRYYFSSPPSFITGTEACTYLSTETEDYKITIADAADCSGAISAGTINAASTVAPNNNFTITATGTDFYQAQMRYAWQKSADNIIWENINNTPYFINPLTTTENSSTYYRLVDTCLVSGQSAVSNSILVTAGDIFGYYCVPAGTIVCSPHGIDSVSFNTIHNGSGCGASGYSNFTNISTTINNGTNTGIFLKLKPAGVTTYAYVWLDLNRNGIFESTEKLLDASSLGNITGNINVPFNVTAGETMMRVFVSQYSGANPCTSSFISGEVEDYKVILNVVNPVNSKFSYYVKQTATGQNTGSNWANAMTSFASALAAARTGDTIRVAKGVYTPGAAAASSFLLKDSLIIWGGYPDTGNPADSERNFSNYQAILSGEIGSPLTATDNIKTIIQASGIKGFVIDGVVIEAGYTSGTNEYGSVYLLNSSGIIKNTVIRKNYSYYNGAALNCINSKLDFFNCFAEANEATTSSNTACVFNVSAKSDITMINTVVAKNKAGGVLNMSNASVKMLGCTVFKNYGYSSIRDTSTLVLQNDIFYYNGNNFTADSAEFIKDGPSAISINNTITEVYNAASPAFIGSNPKFVDTLKIAGADNKYFTNDDGLRLINPCSPAINTGNNAYVASVPADILGNSRIKNGITDMGAYEVQDTIPQQPQVLYVNKTASGLNNGSSWQNAYTDLQAAMNACSDTIKVAKGSYPVSLTDPNASLRLTNNRVLMGGFPPTGSPANTNINTILYPTQIDGKVNATTKVHTVVSSVNNDSTCRLIGFDIINAAIPVFPSQYGALKVSSKSAPYFENLKFDGVTNQAANLVFVTDKSKPVFYKCVFYNGFNRQSADDGSRVVTVYQNSEPLFLKCYFGKDTSAGAIATTDIGGGVFIYGAGGIIDSSYFYRCKHNQIENQNSYPIIRNSKFEKGHGRNIANYTSTPLISNCIFNDTLYNYYTEYNGGSVANLDNSDVTYTKCIFNNSATYRYGGASTNEFSNVLFKNCVFKNCKGGWDHMAIYSKTAHLKLVNCIGYYSGIQPLNGAFPQVGLLSNTEGSLATILNSTIIMPNCGGTPVVSCSNTDTIRLYNSVIWRHGFGAQKFLVANDIISSNDNNAAKCDIRNSILFRQDNTLLTSSSVGINPRLINLSIAEGTDLALYTADDGLKPCTCSPGINAGDNSLNTDGGDILDSNRILNGTIDIGAYELKEYPTTNKTFYVKQNAAAGGDGTGWNSAYNNLQAAVQNNCSDTIKLAKGIYRPAVASRDSSFNIYKGLVMLGGYPDAGNPGNADRNTDVNPTVLSGDLGTLNDSTDNSNMLITIHCPDTTVTLDGLVIEKGNQNISTPYVSGGGAINAIGNKQINIKNCIIQNNYGLWGGGLYASGSDLNVSKTIFRNNNSNTAGGGFYIMDGYSYINNTQWTPVVKFKNCVFAFNKSSAGCISGSGNSLLQRNFFFENIVVYKNEGFPAGFFFSNNPYVSVTNCTFAKNNSVAAGPGISIRVANPYIAGLNTYIYNSIFTGNTMAGMPSSYENSEVYWSNGGSQQTTLPSQNLSYNSFNSNQTPSNSFNINAVSLRDIESGPGPDNKWMTADDGLQQAVTANSIDKGGNTYAQNIPLDITDSIRIRNLVVDMGAYESLSYFQRQLCPPADSTVISSGISSSVYQWQCDNGTGGNFVNISNGINYSGTNTASLTIRNIPSSWYGYQYRCILQLGNYDRITALQFTETWTGAVSSAWENPGNWSCGVVPDAFTDVVINAGTAIINSNVTIHSLNLNPGATLTVTPGNTLTVIH